MVKANPTQKERKQCQLTHQTFGYARLSAEAAICTDAVITRSGSGASTGGSSVTTGRFEPLLRGTDSLIPVPSLAEFPVIIGVGVVAGGLSTLTPLSLLAVLIVILASTGTGGSGLVTLTKVGVSRLVCVLEWATVRSVVEL